MESESEQLLRRRVAELQRTVSAVDQMSAGLVVFEAPGGEVVYQNPAATALVSDVSVLLHATAVNGVQIPVMRAFQGEPVSGIALRCSRDDGGTVWLSLSAAPARDDLGRIVSVTVTFQEIADISELHRRIEQQDAELRFVMDNVPALLSYIDTGQVYRRVNHTYTEWFGYPPEQIVGRTIAEVVGEPHSTRAQPFIARALKGDPVAYESRLRRKDGQLRDIAVQYTPDFAADGSVRGFIALVQDVTERKLQESAFRRAAQRLRMHLENTPVGLVDFDTDFRIIRWSRRAQEIFGWTAAEVIGKRPDEFRWIHDDELEGMRALIEDVQAGRVQFALRSNRNYRKDGTIVHCEWYHSPLFDAEGRPESILSLALDVTDRTNALEALRVSELRFRTALANSPVVVFNQDRDLRYTWRHTSMAGFEPAGIVGKTDAMLVENAEDLATLEALKRAAIESGTGSRQEVRVRNGDREQYFDLTLEPLRDTSGQVQGITGAAVDTTERRQMENALRETNEALRRVNAELEEFAYVASHDLQEPLRAIHVYTQLLLRRFGAGWDDEGTRYARFIQEGVQRIERLIHDVLSYSRTIHEQDAGSQRFNLAAALESAMHMLNDSLRESDATMTHDPFPDVRAELTQIAIVFQNLISNALKYRKRDTPVNVHISAKVDSGLCEVCVSDNGIGFDPAYAEKIFGLFKRLHRDEYPGTGLGLAICKRIVERYGGRIWAESEPGAGSKFCFTLPAATEIPQ